MERLPIKKVKRYALNEFKSAPDFAQKYRQVEGRPDEFYVLPQDTQGELNHQQELEQQQQDEERP